MCIYIYIYVIYMCIFIYSVYIYIVYIYIHYVLCPDVSSLGRMLEAPAGRLDPRPEENRAATSARRDQRAHHCRAFFTSPSSTSVWMLRLKSKHQFLKSPEHI